MWHCLIFSHTCSYSPLFCKLYTADCMCIQSYQQCDIGCTEDQLSEKCKKEGYCHRHSRHSPLSSLLFLTLCVIIHLSWTERKSRYSHPVLCCHLFHLCVFPTTYRQAKKGIGQVAWSRILAASLDKFSQPSHRFFDMSALRDGRWGKRPKSGWNKMHSFFILHQLRFEFRMNK